MAQGLPDLRHPGHAPLLGRKHAPSTLVYRPDQQQEPNVLTYLREKKLDLVVNVSNNLSKGKLDNDYRIRRTAVDC